LIFDFFNLLSPCQKKTIMSKRIDIIPKIPEFANVVVKKLFPCPKRNAQKSVKLITCERCKS